jgi:hypothetical protein
MLAARQRLSATRARGKPVADAPTARQRLTTPMLLAFLALLIGFATGYGTAMIVPLVHFHTEDYAH